jgi:hypothetical protein
LSVDNPESAKAQTIGKPNGKDQIAALEDRIRSTEKWMIGLTAVVAIAAVCAVGVSIFQIRRATEATREALTVTERAYVNVQEVRVVSFEVGKPPEAVATYKNTGLTPAKNAFVVPSSFIREQKNGGSAEPVVDSHWNGCIGGAPPGIRDSMGTLVPPSIVREVDTLRMYFGWDFLENGQARNGILTNIPLEQGDFDAIKYGRKRWYVVVYISYRDQFGGCHSSAEPFVYNFSAKTMEASQFNAKQYDQKPN